MPEPKILIRSKPGSLELLPGIQMLPDTKKSVRMGSGEITELISSGGMAIIYEIWNAELEVKRAIKLLHPDHTKESEDRFQTEMKITAKLHHPNIVEIYAVGKWNDLPYIEMERIDGVTLEALIADSGGLPVEVCTAIGIMTGRALNYAHNQEYQLYGQQYHGIIHRDLKPGNIMVTNEGIVKLMDFGIAKPVTVSMHTTEGVIMGTMQYLAPEQLDGKDIDVRADIYSLGTVLYEMLTGSRSFPEQNLAKLVTDKLNNNYVPLDSYSRKIPPPLCNLVEKCLRYEKEKRMQNALDFLRTLGHVHKTLSDKSPEQILSTYMKEAHHGKTLISIREKKRLPKALTLALVILSLVCCAVFGVLFFKQQHSRSDGVSKTVAAPEATAAVMPKANFSLQTSATMLSVDSSKPLEPKALPEPEIKNVFSSSSPALEKSERLGRAFRLREQLSALASQKNKNTVKSAANAQPPKQIAPETVMVIKKEAPVDKPVKQKEVVQIKPVDKKSTLLGKLKQQFRTSDVLTIFIGEVDNGHFQNALSLYSQLPQDDAETKKVKIYRLRAFKGAGDKAGLEKMFAQEIYDGEFFLEKGIWQYNRREVANAQELLKKASTSPCSYMDAKTFRQVLLFSLALCASAVYDEQLSEDAKKKAMESWYEVKSLFRTSPDNEYFKKADFEIRRLSKSAVASK